MQINMICFFFQLCLPLFHFNSVHSNLMFPRVHAISLFERKEKITIIVSEWQYAISLPENDKYIVARKQFQKTKFSKDSIYID